MPRARVGAWLAVLALLGCTGPALEPGQCRDALDCEIAEFCLQPEGRCDAPGTCSERPQMCTREYRPVCGCDGLEYPNVCGAHAAGVSVAQSGGC